MESFTINICEVKAAMVIEKEPNDDKLPTGENMSKLQSDVQKAKEHERNLTSSADALKEGSGVGYDGQTTCSPN